MYNLAVHHIHKTSGFIIGHKVYGEADKIYYIFTKDFGLIIAIAQGIRLEKSKLRYGLDDYSISSLALVRGKEFWRIVGVEVMSKTDYKPKIKVLARIGMLLKRLIHGEEENQAIFSIIDKINKADEIDEVDYYKNLETLTVISLMNCLGYAKIDKEIQAIISLDSYSKDNLLLIETKRKELNQIINQSLKNTQL